jgi:hypothetical protein
MADWNEFNRELQNRVSEPGVRIILGFMYERILDISKQMDMCSEICQEMAKTMNNFVAMNEAFDEKLRILNKHIRGNSEGVSVESVPLTNDDFN